MYNMTLLFQKNFLKSDLFLLCVSSIISLTVNKELVVDTQYVTYKYKVVN